MAMMAIDIYNADCAEFMRTWNSSKFSAVITDPPYETEMHEAKAKRRNIRNDRGSIMRHIDFDAMNEETRRQLTSCMGKMCSGWMLIFCTPEGVDRWRSAVEAVKPKRSIKYKRACVWVKPDAAPQFNGQGPAMGCEMIVSAWCGKGFSNWNGGGRAGVFSHVRINSESGPYAIKGALEPVKHPTVKPLSLMMELVELFTKPGDTVFDPFMGSGSTGVACVRLGRNFVGVEKDKSYFRIAEQRITSAVKQEDLFVKPQQLKLGKI